ncbi:surface carbohydrate biosynthesis protein [Candidatus Pelagibacter sp.]|uniref:surface carbohydrate biosynthesis protein n=1 Tax=Candidatus Pelagibacter sp. TaxID=2024849 RepID=UPI003F84ECB1
MIFLLPIEIKDREIFSKVFLSYKLLENGHKIIIGSQRDIPQNISKISNCFWFDKNTFISKINKNFDMKYVNKNYIGMLDEEGPLAFFNSTSREIRYPKAISKFYDYFFVWGKEDQKKIKYLNKRISILGHPKYDLLKKPYVHLWDSKVKLIKKKYNDFVLFNSSFKSRPSKANYRKSIITLRDNLPNKKNLKKSLKILDLVFKNEEKNYKETIKLLKELAGIYKSTNFIFRPHPNESINVVKKKFGKIPKNLKIIYQGSVTPWIISSKVVMHSGCTTALEAAVLKKKIICFIPFGNLDRYKIYSKIGKFFNKKNLCIRKFGDFLNTERPNLNLKFTDSIIINSKNNNFFYKNFLKFLIKNNLHKLESKFFISEVETSEIKKSIYNLKQKIKSYISKFKDILIKTPLIYLLDQKYIYTKESREKKIKVLKQSEITKILSQIKKISSSKLNFKVNKISENVFIVKNSSK